MTEKYSTNSPASQPCHRSTIARLEWVDIPNPLADHEKRNVFHQSWLMLWSLWARLVLISMVVGYIPGGALLAEPLLTSAVFNSVVVIVMSLVIVLDIIKDMISKPALLNNAPTSIWLPIKAIMIILALIPGADGMSVLSKALLWGVHLGASWQTLQMPW